MKILVLSDSHGNCEYMIRAISFEKPDYVIHLGDHAEDAERLKKIYPFIPILSVRGNCDRLDSFAPESAEAVYDGVPIWAVHGHLYGVKNSLLRFFLSAKEKAARIALFGHTHCAYCEERDNIWLLNPGSCGRAAVKTYGLIEITNCIPVCSIKVIE